MWNKIRIASRLDTSGRTVLVEDIHGAHYVTIEYPDSGAEHVVAVTAADLRRLGEWILENVDAPSALPAEPGLYQDLSNDGEIHHALTYRVMEDGIWRHAMTNVPLDQRDSESALIAYRSGKLIRLIRDL